MPTVFTAELRVRIDQRATLVAFDLRYHKKHAAFQTGTTKNQSLADLTSITECKHLHKANGNLVRHFSSLNPGGKETPVGYAVRAAVRRVVMLVMLFGVLLSKLIDSNCVVDWFCY